MNQNKEKLKRLEPLAKARRRQLEIESLKLMEIRKQKRQAQQKLETNQKMYIEGVEKLNKQRQSDERGLLLTLERGLDYVKSKWYDSLKILQKLERSESVQVNHVIQAQKELKKIEKLGERYNEQLREEVVKDEQKQLDESAIRQFANKG